MYLSASLGASQFLMGLEANACQLATQLASSELRSIDLPLLPIAPANSYYKGRYGGYAGEASPERVYDLLTAEDNIFLVDIRPEETREKEGLPQLKLGARYKVAAFPVQVGGVHVLGCPVSAGGTIQGRSLPCTGKAHICHCVCLYVLFDRLLAPRARFPSVRDRHALLSEACCGKGLCAHFTTHACLLRIWHEVKHSCGGTPVQWQSRSM